MIANPLGKPQSSKITRDIDMHTTTGRWQLGLVLSLITTFLWGLLPIALKAVLEDMDAYTITWYRFLAAALVLTVFLHRRNELPSKGKLRGRVRWLLLITVLGLCGNYIVYLLGLDILSPSTAQVVIQTAPVFFLFGGLALFRERFNRLQWLGVVAFIIGLLLFFNSRLDELFQGLGHYTTGVLLVVISGAAWAIYALAQKQLLKVFPSQTIMFIIYASGALLFLPFSRPARLLELDRTHLLLLAFCAFNTLVAYGCFAESLEHLEASRVSAVLAITPLITLAFMELFAATVPHFDNPDPINMLGYGGAFMVVGGSMLTVLGKRLGDGKGK